MVDPANVLKAGCVVLASGTGQRFGAPKQFAKLADNRLVDLAVERALAVSTEVVVTLPKGMAWDGSERTVAVEGSDSRLASLDAGVRRLAEEHAHEVVLVFDCIRPFAAVDAAMRLCRAIEAGADAALLGWQPADLVVRVAPDGSIEPVGREGLRITQGPSICRLSVLRAAFEGWRAPDSPLRSAVEETSLIALFGGRVVAVEGDPWSHHVVEPSDLERMERLTSFYLD